MFRTYPMNKAKAAVSGRISRPSPFWGEGRFAEGERNGPADHFEQRTP
jgi:hypothetical protein